MAIGYQVGPDELWDEDFEGFEWVIYWYQNGTWGHGDGEAVSFDGAVYRLHFLGHCSCYGPDVGMKDGDVIALDDILGDTIVPGLEVKRETLDKVRELTANNRR